MSDEKIEVIDAGDGKMPVLSDAELDALGREVWETFRLRAGALDAAKVTGILLAQVLLQISGSPMEAYFNGLQLLQESISSILDARGACGCEEHSHDEGGEAS